MTMCRTHFYDDCDACFKSFDDLHSVGDDLMLIIGGAVCHSAVVTRVVHTRIERMTDKAVLLEADKGSQWLPKDGSRLADYDIPGDLGLPGFKTILPASAILELAKNMGAKLLKTSDVQIIIDDSEPMSVTSKNGKHTSVSTGSVTLICNQVNDKRMVVKAPLIAGEYPRYRELFPDSFKYEGLIGVEVIEDCKLIAHIDDRANLAVLHFSGDTLRVQIPSKHEFITYDRQQPGSLAICGMEYLRIGFNVNYLAHALSMKQPDCNGIGSMILRGDGPLKPWVFTTPDYPNTRMLVMPVQYERPATMTGKRRKAS